MFHRVRKGGGGGGSGAAGVQGGGRAPHDDGAVEGDELGRGGGDTSSCTHQQRDAQRVVDDEVVAVTRRRSGGSGVRAGKERHTRQVAPCTRLAPPRNEAHEEPVEAMSEGEEGGRAAAAQEAHPKSWKLRKAQASASSAHASRTASSECTVMECI